MDNNCFLKIQLTLRPQREPKYVEIVSLSLDIKKLLIHTR